MSSSLVEPAVDQHQESSELDPLASQTDVASSSMNENNSSPKTDQEELRQAFSQDGLKWSNVDWTVFVWMVVMHAGCIAAPFFFSWASLGVAVVLHWMTASIGICLGYHRYLAHRSMKLAKPAEFTVLLCGTLSGEGTPLTWAATHRLHHHKSDHEGDPHSPFEGTFWSHIMWLFVRRTPKQQQILYRRYVPELVQRPMMQFFEKSQAFWMVFMIATIGAAGWLVSGDWTGVASMLLWGVCVRMVVAYHSTWFVNSATHLWGYRNYKTRDQSKNLWWVAIVAYGEGWHNNHHAHPTVAPAGHRWWEIDITWWTIKALRLVGLATDVNDRIPVKGSGSDDGIEGATLLPAHLVSSEDSDAKPAAVEHQTSEVA